MKNLQPIKGRPGRPVGRKFTANIHVSVTPAQRKKVDQICKRRRITHADLIRELIDNV